MDLGGLGAVGEGFFFINSLNFDLGGVLRELLEMLLPFFVFRKKIQLRFSGKH
jgi:hypothetical protein